MAKIRKPALREVEIDLGSLLASQHFSEANFSRGGPVPLSAAVYWIASEGQNLDHDLMSEDGISAYRAAAADLIAKIASGKIRVFGEDENEEISEMRSFDFIGLEILFDFDLEEDFADNTRRLEINVSENGKSRDLLLKPSNRGKWTNLYVYFEEILGKWPLGGDLNTQRSAELGKKPIIKRFLRTKFPDGVPSPAEVPRKTLLGEIITAMSPKYPILKTLSIDTLTTAIAEYNAAPLDRK